MKVNKLGKSDLVVTEFCLGTMTFGEQTDENDAFSQMKTALNAGVNFFDTAELYPTIPLRDDTGGRTEKIIGDWLKKNGSSRREIILATKVVGKGYKAIRNGDPINPSGMRQALNKSLKRLNTDYIDLYQLHWPNRGSYHFRKNWDYDPTDQDRSAVLEDIDIVLDTLSMFVKEGKIRAIGLSNETSWGTMQFINGAHRYDNLCIASIQNEYSLLCRLYDLDMSELSHNENIPLLAYSPLAGGLLTGKYLNNAIPQNSRLSRTPTVFGRVTQRSSEAVAKYVELAKKHGVSPIKLALTFCKSRPFMGSVIFGARTNRQLELVLKSIDGDLSEDIIEEINKINKHWPMTF